jgi:putative ATP-binding cassette transporter
LLSGIDLKVTTGDSLLITGASGKGKSTLLRCLAGLWPYAQGTLSLPDTARSLFVSQKPYLPLGTLRQALYYPAVPKWQDAKLDEVLGLCGLSHLKPRMDEVALWSQILSLGEQQRLAFARVLLCKPDFIFLDEATSALDEHAQMQLYSLLGQYLPQSAVVSVGHRESLRQFHKSEKSF